LQSFKLPLKIKLYHNGFIIASQTHNGEKVIATNKIACKISVSNFMLVSLVIMYSIIHEKSKKVQVCQNTT